MSDKAFVNEDKLLWEKVEGDYYSPSIHVTKHYGIGIDVGGHVIVKPVEDWHSQGQKLTAIKKKVDELIEKNRSDYENIKHINHNIARLQNLFLKDLKELRKILEDV